MSMCDALACLDCPGGRPALARLFEMLEILRAPQFCPVITVLLYHKLSELCHCDRPCSCFKGWDCHRCLQKDRVKTCAGPGSLLQL